MGCDIHLFVEQKINGCWEPVSVPKGWDPVAEEWLAKYPDSTLCPKWYSGRNYALFARLANVRNRENIQPLAEPRGLPSDVSIGVAQEYGGQESNYHSASWLTSAELQGQDWDSPTFPRIVDRMLTLGAPSDVRIVFWFDS